MLLWTGYVFGFKFFWFACVLGLDFCHLDCISDGFLEKMKGWDGLCIIMVWFVDGMSLLGLHLKD